MTDVVESYIQNILGIVFIAVLFYILSKVLSSILQACIATILFLAVAIAVYLIFMSKEQPITIRNTFILPKFNVMNSRNIKK